MRFLTDNLSKVNIDYQICETQKPGHASEIASELPQDIDVLVAVGGDGTLNEIINGIDPQRNLVLGLIPAGSGNDFALNLGLSRDPEDSLNVLFNSEVVCKNIDIGAVEISNANGDISRKRFINSLGIGFDSKIAYLYNKNHFLTGLSGYLFAGLRALFDFRYINMDISTEQENFSGDKLLLTVSNGKTSGGGFYLTPAAKINDKMLDYCAVDPVSRFKLLRSFYSAINKNIESNREVRLGNLKNGRIKLGIPYYIHTDGEPVAKVTELKITMIHSNLNFISKQEL